MSMPTVYLKDYQAPCFTVTQIELTVDLFDTQAIVTNQMVIKKLSDVPLVLNGHDLVLNSIVVDGKPLAEHDYTKTEDSLTLSLSNEESTLVIQTTIYPDSNTTLTGLYRSNGMFCTQCEAEGFRRITYYLDRPDVMSVFTTKIIADKATCPILLSNGNLIEQRDLPAGRQYAIWHDPFKKPAYLFALVAGDLDCYQDRFTTQSKRVIDCRIYVEKGQTYACEHAMLSLKNAMRWDEVTYGREYDLDIFMIVAVSDFNMGAMENKGLNIFNSKYILATKETATDTDYMDIEGIVGHEYFHNWTGNRVTCRDWFQLSLKEGLTVFRDQTFSQDMNDKDVCRIMDVRVLRQHQFPEDAGTMAHPVRPTSYQEINNFYTATVYNKGAEVIRMQYHLLGEALFRRGMDVYFERHDGQAVTIDDFVQSMADSSGYDLTQFKLWYQKAGTPMVTVKTEMKDGMFYIILTQTTRNMEDGLHNKPFYMPIDVAFFDENGLSDVVKPTVLMFRENEQTFSFKGFKSPPIVSVNRGFSAPIHVQYTRPLEDALHLIRHEIDGFSQWDTLNSLAIQLMQTAIHKKDTGLIIPQAMIDVYRDLLLDTTISFALKGELFTLPSFEDTVMGLTNIDVDCVMSVRDAYMTSLVSSLAVDMLATYQALANKISIDMDAKGYGERRLKNVMLQLLTSLNHEAYTALAETQFKKSRLMTDKLHSFQCLVDSTNESVRLASVEAFYQEWEGNPLVLEKWFSVQAMGYYPFVLTTIKQLITHPKFSYTNPNKVRSVVGVFSQLNPRYFHVITGEGYQFLSEQLKQLDSINPQVAAKMANPFTRLARYDEPRQRLMKQYVEGLLKNDLSKDLTEVLSSCLK